MRITGVNFKENTNNTNKVNLNQINPINAFALHFKNIQLNSLDKDIFVKQTPSTDNIAFTGEVKFTTNEFKKKFNKTFFKKLMREDIPDAYTGNL